MEGHGTVHLSRLPLGTDFVSGDNQYTLVTWSVCSASVRVQKSPKLVQITDSKGKEREFYAQQGGITRITSDLRVQVKAGTPLLEWGHEHS